MAATASQTTIFQPNQISGCHMWLDAAKQTNFTFSSGSNIATWIDRSGNGFTATAANSPTYDSQLKRVRFTSTLSQYLSNTAATLDLSQRSIFCVIEETTNANSRGILPFIPNPSTGNDYQTTTGLAIVTTSGFRLSANNGGYVNTISGVPLAKSIYEETFTNPNGILYLNGTQSATATATYTPGSASGFLVGGRWDNGVIPPFFDGFMYEIVVFNSALSTQNRQIMEGYLAWKWGLQSSLPANHPFRSTPVFAYPPFPSVLTPLQVSPTPLFAPTFLPNCSLWLDGADIKTMFRNTAGTDPLSFTGQQIGCWKDKSSNANHATSSSTQPTVLLNSQNGKTAVNFNGAQYLTLDSTKLPNGATPATFFFVTRTTSSSVQVFFTYGANPNATNRNPQFYYNSGALTVDTYGAGALSDNTSYLNSYAIFSGTFSTTLNSAWDNGAVFSGGTTAITLNTGTGYASIGVGRVISTLQFYFTGQIGEIIVYSRELSTTERQQIEGYLATKWGLNGNLTSGQPYQVTRFFALPPFPSVLSIPPMATMSGLGTTAFPNLAAWYDAADSTTFSLTGISINTWTDKSGNSKTATGSTTKPVLALNSLNKKPVVTFNGTNQYFSTAVTVDYASHCLVAVHRPTTSGGNFSLFRFQNTPTPYIVFPYGTRGYITSANGTAINFQNSPLSENSSTTAFNLIVANIASGSQLIYNNGTLQNSTTETITAGTSDTMVIGYYVPSNAEYYSGSLAEMMVFSATLTTPQRQRVEGYLAWKWGLVGSLPATHPYKLFPPPP